MERRSVPDGLPVLLFCRTGTGSSKEHLFSQWTAQVLGRRYSHSQSFTRLWEHETEELVPEPLVMRTHQGDALSKKVRGFCDKCNNEWMSQIEAAAIPIATPMMQSAPVTTLDVDQQRKLANWVTLKSLVARQAFQNPVYYPDDVYDFFYSKQQPLSGSRVYIAAYNGRNPTPFCMPCYKGIPGATAEDPITLAAACTFFAWKKFFAIHTWSANPEYPFEFPRSRARQLALVEPIAGAAVQFPVDCRPIDDVDMNAMFTHFGTRLPLDPILIMDWSASNAMPAS